MTLLGKLLIVFNLLAAGGFVYLATQDWKGRQNITAASVRFKLYLTGLPFEGPEKFDAEDETPFRIDTAGSFTTETISKKILEVYFQSAPPSELGEKGPVPTQIAELKRVKAKIESILKDKPDDKIANLKGWLIEQCENYEQRVEVLDLVSKGNTDELEKRLLAMFDAVLAPPTPTVDAAGAKVDDGADEKTMEQKSLQVAESRLKPLDPSERQFKAAQLLAFLSPDPNWQKRVMIVVGLRRYVNAIAVQSFRYRDMSARMEKLIITDQVGYQQAEKNLLQLAQSRTELANAASKLKLEKIEENKKEDTFIEVRKTQLATIQNQLLKIKAEVDDLLVKQSKIEAGLFEIQREVAVTLDEVYLLEEQLAAREKELLNPKK